MRIVTWNVNGNPLAWDYLVERVGPDICLLQEYTEKVDSRRPGDWRMVHANVVGKPHYWDTVIAARGMSVRDLGFHEFPGRVVVADVGSAPEEVVRVVNIHAQRDGGDYPGWTEDVLDRLEELIVERSGRLIIGGDLNMGLFYDRKYGIDTNKRLIERLLAYGLKMFPETERQTHRHRRQQHPEYPDDYLFISSDLINAARPTVLYDDVVERLSDHNPVCVDLLL